MTGSFQPRVGKIPVNPHQVEGDYNGVECDIDDPRMTLRHFYGTDVMAAVHAAGRLNGRSSDIETARDIVQRAIREFGAVREVYFPENSLEVTASFGDMVYNRLWIAGGYINSRGKLHERQYLHASYEGIWTLDFVDRPGAREARTATPKPPVCAGCFLALPLHATDECPSCGRPVSNP